jgi:hypothetical protein
MPLVSLELYLHDGLVVRVMTLLLMQSVRKKLFGEARNILLIRIGS